MRTFSCTTYDHVDPERRDVKSTKYYYIGYGSNMFEYRHYDITFDEDVSYNDKEKKDSQTTNQVGVEVELQ